MEGETGKTAREQGERGACGPAACRQRYAWLLPSLAASLGVAASCRRCRHNQLLTSLGYRYSMVRALLWGKDEPWGGLVT